MQRWQIFIRRKNISVSACDMDIKIMSAGGSIIDDAKQPWRQFLSAAGVPTIHVTDSEIQPRRGVVFLKILKGLAEKDDRSRKNSSPRLLMERLNSKFETGPKFEFRNAEQVIGKIDQDKEEGL